MNNGIVRRLQGVDRRSIGRANEVAAAVLADPSRLDDLFNGLGHPDAVVRIRAADALEKVSVRRPELLQPYKSRLLGGIAESPEAAVRWHVAQMIPRLTLSSAERKLAFALLVGYLGAPSSIVRTFALQALADLALADRRLRPAAESILRDALASGTPAMRSRARKLSGALLTQNRESVTPVAKRRRG